MIILAHTNEIFSRIVFFYVNSSKNTANKRFSAAIFTILSDDKWELFVNKVTKANNFN